MKKWAVAILALAAACAGPERPKDTPTRAVPAIQGAKRFNLVELDLEDDNVVHDTLLIYTTHALGNGHYIMAARNQHETREGLMLLLYEPGPDSSARVIAKSKPAYDSEVMFPTFFSTGDTADGWIILANYGGWDSWGQNVFWLKDRQFHDLGWLDVARRTWVARLDSVQQKRGNIAPFTTVEGRGGEFNFTFTTDSVQLYDDLRGHPEIMLPSGRIGYRYANGHMQLYIDGQGRERLAPL